MIKFYVLILIVLFSSSAVAQSLNFEKGYIILSGDTTMGYIHVTSDEELSHSIKFKSDSTSENVKVYYPNKISGFGLYKSGFFYTSVKAEIRVGENVQLNTRFAKLILSGFTNLYKLQLPVEEQSIILKKNNTFIYIVRKDEADYTLGHYETMVDGGVKHDKRYIGMLRALFYDCNSEEFNKELKGLDNLRFEDKSIIDIVSAYNICKDPTQESSISEYKSNIVLKHGVEASYAFFYFPQNVSEGSGQGVSVGYFWDWLQPDLSRKLSTRVGANYLYLRRKHFSVFSENDTYNVHHIRVPLSAQINFKDPIKSSSIPFINIGITAQAIKYPAAMDFISSPHFGVGIYSKKIHYSMLVENAGFSLNDPKIINLSAGFRLD